MRGVVVPFLAALVMSCSSFSQSTVENIGSRRVEYAITRGHSAPVIFENGLDGRLEWWNKVLGLLPEGTTTFVYNRPGYGNSERVATSRDGAHIVDELRDLIRAKGLNPPYVLVGHSLGGLYMQLFARRYPEEVAALILVDTTHPQQLEGEGALEKQSFLVRLLLDFMVTGSAKQELDLLSRTGEEVLSLPPLMGKPVFVLSAKKPMMLHSPFYDEVNRKRNDIVRLHPGSTQILVDGDHGIPLEAPEAVVSAIDDALKESLVF